MLANDGSELISMATHDRPVNLNIYNPDNWSGYEIGQYISDSEAALLKAATQCFSPYGVPINNKPSGEHVYSIESVRGHIQKNVFAIQLSISYTLNEKLITALVKYVTVW